MLIPDPRRTPLPNLISHNGVILYQWEFLRARLDEGEGLPWIAMENLSVVNKMRQLGPVQSSAPVSNSSPYWLSSCVSVRQLYAKGTE